MSFQRIVILGAGTMGRGMAQWAAQNHRDVQLTDTSPKALEMATQKILASWDKLKARGKFTDGQVDSFRSHLHLCSKDGLWDSPDLLIEAIPESLPLKKSLFQWARGKFSPHTLLASNTSSLSIKDMGADVGLHFFNPAPVMKLVELAPGPALSPQRQEALVEFLKSCGKVVAICQDRPGFIVNRICRNFYGEPLRLVAQAPRPQGLKEIDHILKTVGGFPMGPFELMDLIGVGVNLSVTQSLWEQFSRPPRLAPHPLQKDVANSPSGKFYG